MTPSSTTTSHLSTGVTNPAALLGGGLRTGTITFDGSPLQNAADAGLVEVLYLSSLDIAAAQLLTISTDEIRAQNVRRLVHGSATRLEPDDLDAAELPHLLHALVVRFEALGVTSLLPLESSAMFATDTVRDRGLSPIADELLRIRCVRRLEHGIGIVKTRGSKHTKRLVTFRIGDGGITRGPRVVPGHLGRAWEGEMA